MSEQLEGRLIDILALAGVTTLAAPGTTTVWSYSFPLFRNCTFGWEVQMSSLGVVDVKIELEQGNTRPTNEGTTDAAWVIPDNKIATLMFTEITDTNVHITAYAPDATGFGRLKITGLGANAASTALAKAKMYAIKGNP